MMMRMYASFLGVKEQMKNVLTDTKRGLESASEGGKMVLLSQDGFSNPLINVGISESVELLVPQLTRDDSNEGETWRFSSQAALGSIARNSFSGNYQCADEQIADGHVIWQGSDATHVGRRSRSPNTSWLLQRKCFDKS